ncbi:hypothetical protein SAMN04487907_102371 [Zunongwangia mangrovi]|uniref:Lipoprotein n=1 Tax=Zunongwangia mangrovi TaxID=1334022 RepID=A0A1I1GQT3_9FLAO|nr:hypothetical protein [Zunongwangia mangrovi]SFC13825.1 hypothetical protein SAMN04487907_102371 [Zunongwangia mangrovi]
MKKLTKVFLLFLSISLIGCDNMTQHVSEELIINFNAENLDSNYKKIQCFIFDIDRQALKNDISLTFDSIYPDSFDLRLNTMKVETSITKNVNNVTTTSSKAQFVKVQIEISYKSELNESQAFLIRDYCKEYLNKELTKQGYIIHTQ